MEAAAYALVGEDGDLSDDAETGQPGGWHRSRVPMAISHDGARGSSSAHAMTATTEPNSISTATRTDGGDAEPNRDQSVAEALDSVEAPFEGVGPASELGTSEQEILSNLIQRARCQCTAAGQVPCCGTGRRLICLGQLPDLLPGFVERCALDAQT